VAKVVVLGVGGCVVWCGGSVSKSPRGLHGRARRGGEEQDVCSRERGGRRGWRGKSEVIHEARARQARTWRSGMDRE
jgi:hypothetical protein